MSRLDPHTFYTIHIHYTDALFYISVKQERHDIEHASQSGSEDGSYALYPDANRIEGDAEGTSYRISRIHWELNMN